MPIDFPTSPATGQTYSYGINRWIYNGVAWDKLDNHPGISAGNQISVGYQESLSGATFSVNVIEGSGSDLDADLLDGVSGERFIENLQTGVLYGGLVSINAGNTATFDVSAGAGIIVNIGGSTTGYPTPTLTNVSWTAKTGVTTGYLGSTEETFISINSSGNLVLQSTAWSEAQYESQIPIGTLFHHGTGYIDLAISIPHISYGQAQQFDPFIRAFGPLKLNGYELTGSTADFKIYKSSGKAYLMGRNYAVDPNNPNVVTDTASNPVQYYYMFYRDGSGGFDTTILTTGTDVTNYDDGTGILNSAPSGKYTTQRIFGLPNQPNVLGIYYGREIYNSLEDAKANIQYETFSESEATSTQGVFLGYLVCKANATNLGTTGDHEFIASGLFRNTSNIGGGGLAFSALTDLSDVNISSPSNNQALIYDSSTSAWVNKSFSDLPVVTSFNGLTGAVSGVGSFNGSTGTIIGVNSVRGLTGAVGITNGSGIGLSVSGQTMTVSNTGVLSINGSTGAITNVARTNVNNNFTTNQSIDPSLQVVDTNVTGNYITIEPSSNQITNYQDLTSATGVLQFSQPAGFGYTVTIPATTTVLAGLSNTQTFTSTNTFNALTNFPGGIDAAGATFSTDIFIGNQRLGKGLASNGNTGSLVNTIFGYQAGEGQSTSAISNSNVLIGSRAGYGNGFTAAFISGLAASVAVGTSSLFSATAGANLTAIGTSALFTASGVNVQLNTAVGSNSLRTSSSGSRNTAIGSDSLRLATVINNSVGLGVDSGRYVGTGTTALTTGTGGIYIGYRSRGSTADQTNEIVIGTDALGLGSNTAVIGATSQTAATIYGLLNAPGGISAAGATFTGLARFTAGISASGGITFSPRVYVDGNILTSPNGVIESGYNGWFRGLQWVDPNGGRARIVLNYSSTPRSIDFKVDGVSFDGSGELTRMQIFASGVSCSQGATFSGNVAVNGGDITTTSTSASLFNANATTLNVLNTQSSGFTLNIGSATSYSGTKNINIGGNIGGGAGENIRIGSSSSASKITILGGITLGAVGGSIVRVAAPSQFEVESGASFNKLAAFNAGISASGATFSGLVSSTVGFSGPGTNLTGNASGLTAGTSSKVIVTSTDSPSTFYPVFAGGAGNTALYADTSIGPLSYVPSSATLKCTNLDLGAGQLTINGLQLTATDYFYFVATNGIYLQDSTLVSLGDIGAAGSKTLLEVVPVASPGNSGYVRILNYDYSIPSIASTDATLLVNRTAPTGPFSPNFPYAIESNHSSGRALKLIYNDTAGAATNYVNFDVSSTGDLTISPSSTLTQFVGGLSAAGATFNGTVTVSGSNILNAGSIQTDKAALEIDTARATSRVAIGDINNLANGTHIYMRNALSELDIINPLGYIKLGDVNGIDTGNYIYYYSSENRLSSDTNSNITGFNQIFAITGFYETANEIRVTNNARSWFL